MQLEFVKLQEEILRRAKRGPVYYLANPGNWGDALIRFGTLKFFANIGLNYRELTTRKINWLVPLMTGGTVVYGGGGAWCNTHNASERRVRALRKRFHVIVLPSSYEQRITFGERVTFFARDFYESQQNNPQAIFCHDMAFYIGRLKCSAGIGTGWFFRTDKESAGVLTPKSENCDLSAKGDTYSDMFPFFAHLARYAIVHTDRLHIAIASCLLGKEVHIYPGSYFKIRAVFKSSIEGAFDKVYLHEIGAGGKASDGVERDARPR